MTQLISEERIGKSGAIRLGCSAAIFDSAREKILLTHRADNGQWCLPGGAIDPGESVTEGCEREIREETGLRIRVKKLTGVYSNPNQVIEYADGNRFQIVALNFEADVVGGEFKINDEVTEMGYFSLADIEQADLMSHHRERILDAFAGQAEVFIK
jgi:ADP-ribose pyrophosphatase YjhB (NUDIX family)